MTAESCANVGFGVQLVRAKSGNAEDGEES